MKTFRGNLYRSPLAEQVRWLLRPRTGGVYARRPAASRVGYGQLTCVVSSNSTELGHKMLTPQPTQNTRTTEPLLALVSRSVPGSSTVTDRTISRVIRLSRLRAEQGPAVALLKVAHCPLGAEELRMQRRALAEIACEPGLDEEWRELLPRILALNERTDATISVESYLPGLDLTEVLARHPNRVEELTAAALRAIAPLHRATARLMVVDNMLRQWVVEPVAELKHICQRMDPCSIAKLDQVETLLQQALVHRRMPVSWTHGDYVPGNVRVAAIGGPVNSIVGWGGAQGESLALLDEYLIILAAGAQAQRADLGTVVSERLRAGGLLDCERNTLRAGCGRSGADIGDSDGIDERLAILLAWLHHTASVWRKRATQPNHHIWWAAQVAPVLEAVADWRGSPSVARYADALPGSKD
jgi:hypothetical protein